MPTATPVMTSTLRFPRDAGGAAAGLAVGSRVAACVGGRMFASGAGSVTGSGALGGPGAATGLRERVGGSGQFVCTLVALLGILLGHGASNDFVELRCYTWS